METFTPLVAVMAPSAITLSPDAGVAMSPEKVTAFAWYPTPRIENCDMLTAPIAEALIAIVSGATFDAPSDSVGVSGADC